ncbi:MAG: hypothetical protein HYX86_00765 [Chloroflexi bacterium]|nr:hypothetical protein [Chloroflexota bacterium]
MYRCMNCGYQGENLIFTLVDHTACLATNESDPEYLAPARDLAEARGYGDAEIGEPIGCPTCRAWGVDKFEEIDGSDAPD